MGDGVGNVDGEPVGDEEGTFVGAGEGVFVGKKGAIVGDGTSGFVCEGDGEAETSSKISLIGSFSSLGSDQSEFKVMPICPAILQFPTLSHICINAYLSVLT